MKYKIGDLAKILAVSTNTVRRYEKMGHIKAIRSEKSGYRYYEDDAVFELNALRLLRKHCFTHEQIDEMGQYNLEQMISCYQDKMTELDEKIKYLTYVRHRIKDDLLLMNKANSDISVYEKNNMHEIFVLYKEGERLLIEPERLEKIQEFLYCSPEVQHICIIRKTDLDKGKFIINMGWAVKEMHMEKYALSRNEYTEDYISRPSLMGFVKLPMKETVNYIGCEEKKRELVLGKHFKYMKERNLSVAGDILMIVIAKVREEETDFVEFLVSIPIE